MSTVDEGLDYFAAFKAQFDTLALREEDRCEYLGIMGGFAQAWLFGMVKLHADEQREQQAQNTEEMDEAQVPVV